MGQKHPVQLPEGEESLLDAKKSVADLVVLSRSPVLPDAAVVQEPAWQIAEAVVRDPDDAGQRQQLQPKPECETPAGHTNLETYHHHQQQQRQLQQQLQQLVCLSSDGAGAAPAADPLASSGASPDVVGVGANACTADTPAASPHGEATPPGEEERLCRMCLAEECDFECEAGRELICPCRCSGSMKYVHRGCLDTWRASCFNPKALLECTTCNTPFRTKSQGPKDEVHPYTRLALDIAAFLAIRFAGFVSVAGLLGFWPPLLLGAGVGVMHRNPVVNHMLAGTASALALIGSWVFVQLPGATNFNGVRVLSSALLPRRAGSGGKGGDLDGLIILLVIVGVLVCLWFLIKGIYRLVTETQHEVTKAIRGANQQARLKILQQHIVLNYHEEEPQEVQST